MSEMSSKHTGWEVFNKRGPISRTLRIEYANRPVLITGKNGFGKTSLLSLLMDQTSSSLVFHGLPRRVKRYWDLFTDLYNPDRLNEANLSEYRRRLLDRDPLISGSTTPRTTYTTNTGLQVLETVIGPTHVEFRLGDNSQRFRLEMLPEDQSSESSFGLNTLRWNKRADEVVTDLSAETKRAFARWLQLLIDRTRGEYRPTANPLAVCEVETERFLSALGLADDWARRVAERASRRFELALGIGTQLRCSAPEDFSWEFYNQSNWLSIREMSSGLRRCVALVLLDTLAEVEQHVSDDHPGSRIDFQLERLPIGSFPHSSPQLFGGGRTWLALDEPELHLYPTEVKHLANAIAELKHAHNVVIATHSLEFLSSFYGRSEIHVFEAPGTLTPPSRLRSNQLLQRLVDDSPAIMARITLLYVEGKWDLEILTQVFGDDLEAAGVLVKVLGGVVDSKKEITSPAELLGRPSWVLFDGLSATTIQAEWEASITRIQLGERRDWEVNRLLRLAADTNKFEVTAMYELLARTLQQRVEGLVHLISHEMSDITEVIHPHRWGFNQNDWESTGFSGGSFKDFILKKNPINPYAGPNDRDDRSKAFTSLLTAAIRRTAPNLWEQRRLNSLRTALAPLLTEGRR